MWKCIYLIPNLCQNVWCLNTGVSSIRGTKVFCIDGICSIAKCLCNSRSCIMMILSRHHRPCNMRVCNPWSGWLPGIRFHGGKVCLTCHHVSSRQPAQSDHASAMILPDLILSVQWKRVQEHRRRGYTRSVGRAGMPLPPNFPQKGISHQNRPDAGQNHSKVAVCICFWKMHQFAPSKVMQSRLEQKMEDLFKQAEQNWACGNTQMCHFTDALCHSYI